MFLVCNFVLALAASPSSPTQCVPVGQIVQYSLDYAAFTRAMLDAIKVAPMQRNDVNALLAGMPCAPPDGLWLEFGVFRGRTIRMIANYLLQRPRPNRVFGFDSFNGLPERWRNASARSQGFQKGAFSLAGRPPFPAGDGIEWVIGWFNESLPPFLAAHAGTPLSFVHVDCDLYSATTTIFTELAARRLLAPGVVLVFDELINYPEYKLHELKALWELLGKERASRLAVEVLGTSTHTIVEDRELWPQSVAMRLVAVERGAVADDSLASSNNSSRLR